jgi:5-methylthioadenosine/S-adenosylhomocysteine deaminase
MKEDKIIRLANAHIVSMDDEYHQYDPGDVVIQGDTILAVGEAGTLDGAYHEAEVIDFTGKVIVPGLINAHTHVPMTLLRGLADDLRLDVWLMGYMMPVEREFVSPDFCRVGTGLACAEMIRSGITCFVDMYYFEEQVAQSTADAGLRAICGQTILKFPSPDAPSYEDALARTRQFLEAWKDHPLIVPAVAPHAPYTSTPEILKACVDMALEFDVPLHTHLAETANEVEEWREQYDMPVIPWVKKQGLFEAKVIAAHCVHVDDGEIHTLQHANAGVAHNPSSNLKLASGFAPVTEMLETGLNVGVGTDGPASNNDLDIFDDMRLASFIAKAVTNDPTVLPARQTFAMATRMGAAAIHLDHMIGSIQAGKKADLVVLDLEKTHNLPSFKRTPDAIYSQLVYSAKSTDVTNVMVAGRWLMTSRQLLTIDETSLQAEAAEYAHKIDAFLIKREGSVLSKLIAIGDAEQEQSYEIQIKVKIADPEPIIGMLRQGELDVVRSAHYREFDTYFNFNDPQEGRLRYREDEFIDEDGEVFNIRYRLTLTGPAAEWEFPNSVLLSRSRYYAPANHSLRFYREYFQPDSETTVQKDRLRWLIRFQEEEFFINIDTINQPELDDCFLEIKSRTWSRRDAEHKAELISKLLVRLGIPDAKPELMEYPDLADSPA